MIFRYSVDLPNKISVTKQKKKIDRLIVDFFVKFMNLEQSWIQSNNLEVIFFSSSFFLTIKKSSNKIVL